MCLLTFGLRRGRLYLALWIQVGSQINRGGGQLGKFAIFVASGALGHLHNAWIAVVSLRTRASDSGESGKQSDKLEHFMGGDAHAERENIAARVPGLLPVGLWPGPSPPRRHPYARFSASKQRRLAQLKPAARPVSGRWWVIGPPAVAGRHRPLRPRPAGRSARPRPRVPVSNGLPLCPECGRRRS